MSFKFLIYLGMAWLLSWSEALGQNIRLITWETPDKSIALKHLASWQEINPINGTLLTLLSPKEGPADHFPEMLTLRAVTTEKVLTITDLQSWQEANLREVGADASGSVTAYPDSKVPFVQSQFSFNNDNRSISVIIISFIHSDKIFMLTLPMETSKKDAYTPTLLHVFDSLKLR